MLMAIVMMDRKNKAGTIGLTRFCETTFTKAKAAIKKIKLRGK